MNTKHIFYLKTGDAPSKWNIVEEILSDFYDIIDKAEPLYPGQVLVEIGNSDEQIDKFKNVLNVNEISYEHRKKRTYTKKEVLNSQYALINVSAPWFQQGKYARDFGTEYSIPSCNSCNNQKKQEGLLHISEKRALKYDICTIVPEIIIGEKVQKIVSSNHYEGYEILDVYRKKSCQISVLKQLIPTNTLPPMSRDTGAVLKRCPECTTLLIDYIFDEIAYNQSDLSYFKDFNFTYEQFLADKSSEGVPCGLCIVSNRVISMFIDEKVRNVQFEPIKFM